MIRTYEVNRTKLQHPFSAIIAGGRRTGKTEFTKSILLQRDRFITSSIDHIIWLYASAPQTAVFDELKHSLANIEFIHDLPNDGVDAMLSAKSGNKLIILDDLMEEASERLDVKHLFTRGRHDHVSVIFLTQNIFHRGKHSREMSLNADYMVLFKNPRDKTIITNLGKQMENVLFLKWAYKDATEQPFSYLFIDLRADTDELLRYRARILDDIQIVYVRTHE